MDVEGQKEYEKRVKERVLILLRLLKEGRIKIPYDSQIEQSLLSCRYDSNGEPDLNTVDGVVRSLALMAEDLDYKEKLKSGISLSEIQKRYFEYIEINFGSFYKEMLELKLTPHDFAYRIANYKDNADYIQDKIQLFLKDITEFWSVYSEAAYVHVEDAYDSIKAVFGGDLFPAHNENIASKCGIYTDIIILPCPFIRSRGLFGRWNKYQQTYYLMKHALNLLQYKLLATVDTDCPVVAVVPDENMLSEEGLEDIARLGDKDALFHAEKIFKRKFQSMDELFGFANELNTIDKVLAEIKDPKRVLFDTEYDGTLRYQIDKEMNGQSAQLLRTNNPGTIIAALGVGRMNNVNDILLKSFRLQGTPLIDAPTSWQYFKWKMEYDAERSHPQKDLNRLHIVRGLNSLSNTPLHWIGKIPPQGLIELRKSGAINEIRAIISQGLEELTTADYLSFDTTSNKIFTNLNDAFVQHQKNIRDLVNKKWKVAGKDIGSWLVTGTIEIAAACTGTPLYGLSSVVLNQILDAPKLKDLPNSIKKIQQLEIDKQKIKRSPIGMIFQYKK